MEDIVAEHSQKEERTEGAKKLSQVSQTLPQPIKVNSLAEINPWNNEEQEFLCGEDIRSPNGSLLPNSVKVITNYFARKCQSSEKSIFKSQSSVAYRTSQSVKALSQPRKSLNRVNKKTARKLRSQAEKVASAKCKRSRQGSVNSSQNKLFKVTFGESSDQSFTTTDDENSDFDSLSLNNKRDEDQFLHFLDAQLRSKSKMNRSCDNQDQKENNLNRNQEDSMEVTLDSSNKSRVSDEVTIQKPKSNEVAMEENQEKNPEAMSIVSVVEMFTRLRDEMKKGMEDLNTKMEQINISKVSDEDKEQIKTDLAQALDVEIQNDRKDITRLKEDLKLFKFRNRALTNVVERMSVEMKEMKQRLENIELSGCRMRINSLKSPCWFPRKKSMVSWRVSLPNL